MNMGCGGSTPIKELSEQDIQLLKKSWADFNEGDITENGAHMYFRLFTVCPEAQKMFGFDENVSITLENYQENAKFCKHVRRVFTDTFGKLVDGVDDVEPLVPMLKDLGARHQTYGVTNKQYGMLGNCLLYALERKLGAAFTKDMKRVWASFFSVIEVNMKVGMDEERAKASA